MTTSNNFIAKSDKERTKILNDFFYDELDKLNPKIKGLITENKLLDRKISRHRTIINNSSAKYWIEEEGLRISEIISIELTN